MAESSLGGASSFIGNTIGEAAAFAAGLAIGPVLRPLLQALENETWALYPDKPLDPQTMAIAVAQGRIDEPTGQAEAALSGIGPTAFKNLVAFAQSFPDTASLFDLRRRNILPDADLIPALERQGLTPEYAGFVAKLIDARLSAQQVALGIVRGLIQDPGLMPVNLDTSGGVVPAYPVSSIDALQEAADEGIDEPRLRVMVGSIGLPMSTQQAANAYFRGIIKLGDFNRSILEGDVRPEWASAILEQSRQYPSAHDYVEQRLRGWTDDAGMYAGTAKHGMSQPDTDLLLQINGRPLSFHQTFIGLARGGVYNGPTTGIDPAFLKSLEESNIRPEWYNLAWAQRFTYPAAFILRTLTQAGDITAAEAEQILLYEGWEPTLAATVSAKWGGGTGTTAAQKKQTLAHLTDEYLSGALTRAALVTALTALGYTATQANDEINLAEFNASKAVRTKATTAIGKRYIALQLTQAQAEQDMLALGWPQGAVDKYVAGWNAERDDEGTTLTKAQVVKAAKLGTLSQADAATRLGELGVSAPDAAILLADA